MTCDTKMIHTSEGREGGREEGGEGGGGEKEGGKIDLQSPWSLMNSLCPMTPRFRFYKLPQTSA